MRKLLLIGLFALAGCEQDSPDHSAKAESTRKADSSLMADSAQMVLRGDTTADGRPHKAHRQIKDDISGQWSNRNGYKVEPDKTLVGVEFRVTGTKVAGHVNFTDPDGGYGNFSFSGTLINGVVHLQLFTNKGYKNCDAVVVQGKYGRLYWTNKPDGGRL
ncbi:MAG: hypothetical protein ACXVIY_03100, partial [Mucilaginibacter sp.]